MTHKFEPHPGKFATLYDALVYGVRQVIIQGKASETKNFSCAYRGDDGCKCVIGHIFPDGSGFAEGENLGSFTNSGVLKNVVVQSLDRPDFSFAIYMQISHDSIAGKCPSEKFAKDFWDLAKYTFEQFKQPIPDVSDILSA